MKGDISRSIDMEITEEHVKNNSVIKLQHYTPPLPLIVSRTYFLQQNFNFRKVLKGESNLSRHPVFHLLKCNQKKLLFFLPFLFSYNIMASSQSLLTYHRNISLLKTIAIAVYKLPVVRSALSIQFQEPQSEFCL